ncbi:MAG: hypothetical protein M1834_006242 [Cirrosporium novae-zelandiae]|nr:MAG: hypothetical protein M1834_006242 [Cirrosporium novae-zelandiae]
MPERSNTVASEHVRRSSVPISDLKHRSSSASSLAASKTSSRSSLPYPTFSKAHSKEAVGSRETIQPPRVNLYTPDPTDLEKDGKGPVNGEKFKADGHAPPSPPLTSMDQSTYVKSDSSHSKSTGEEKEKKHRSKGDHASRVRRTKSSASSGGHHRKRKDDDRSTILSSKVSKKSSTSSKSRSKEKESSKRKTKPKSSKTRSPSPVPSENTQAESVPDSDATSIAPDQPQTYQEPIKTPMPMPRYDIRSSTPDNRSRETFIGPGRTQTPDDRQATASSTFSPRPPPPPPPPQVPANIPRVDYLLMNGGLRSSIPKSICTLAPSNDYAESQIGTETQLSQNPASALSNVFAPFADLLDDYSTVVAKNGSIAVATGYRSVARRLLDRLEAVFARDISSEHCQCIICQSLAGDIPEERGVSWGEVLELVSGRRDLPPWPAFEMDTDPVGLGITSLDQPMQKLDIDVPEEFRDHYIRQSQKTKKSVDRWLLDQGTAPTNAPTDVDDDTLTFAILTHIPPEKRQIFTGLLGVPSAGFGRSSAKPKERPESLIQAGLAIQRLYRLGVSPRDPETAVYLLNNPAIHNILATLAAISNDEWEILISGRFDGFLRSGAEDMYDNSPPGSSIASSRVSTNIPFRPGTASSMRSSTTRAGTPAAFGAPIALDEEAEVAILAEVEREIYLGMEALEDAFEALHCKAEAVRRSLRERSAGLAMAIQVRRGYSNVSVRLGTPSEFGADGWDGETDDGLGDTISLAPDDSASNISSNRHRRPKRRNERRTPALVEEEEDESDDGVSRHYHHRRSRK